MSVIIIAEAGVNHNGNLDMAKELVDKASESGADFVKFQTFKTELAIAPGAAKAEYQVKNAGQGTMYDMVKKLELSYDSFLSLKKHCEYRNIGFLSTPFDIPSIDFLNDHQDIFKVPSGELTHLPYLRRIANLQKPVILSTGMANLREISQAVDVFVSRGISKEKLTVLHCNTEYPTPMQDVNLKAMLTIKEKLGVSVGYSDHTLGIEVPIAAVALGAQVIEKHFTLDRSLPGPDHLASLEPGELKDMVISIRNIEKAISGSGLKVPSPSEIKNTSVARKSIHLRHDLPKDHVLSEEDLICLRPGDGISPMQWDSIVGKKLNSPQSRHHKLSQKDLTNN